MSNSGVKMMRALGCVMLLAALTAAPALGDYDEGLRLFRAKKYAEAAAEWDQVVANAPDYAYGYYMLGNCYLKLKKYKDAEMRFRRAIEIEPGKFDYHANLAQTLMQLKRYADVVKLLDEAEPLAATSANRDLLHRLRGLSLMRTKDYARAATDLKDAQPEKRHSIASALTRACFETNDLVCLRTAAKQALKLKASDEKSQGYLVRSLVENARRTRKKALYGEAIPAAATYVKIAKDKGRAYSYQGAAMLGSEKWQPAINAFQNQLKHQPKKCHAMLNISTAQAELAAGLDKADPKAAARWQDSLSWAQKAAKCDPKSAMAFNKQALAFNKLKRWNDAIAAADNALKVDPSNGFANQMKRTARTGIDADQHNAAVKADEERVKRELAAQEAARLAEEERQRKWKILQGEQKKKEDG